MPMVKDKGVTKINGGMGFGETSSAFDLNLFHSVSNSIGVMGNFSSMYLDGNALNSVDLGAGYFHPFDESSGFEIYSTVGFGDFEKTDDDYYNGQYGYSNSSTVYRLSLQPDVFYAGKHFEAAFGIRLHYFSFSSTMLDYDYNYINGNVYGYDAIDKDHLMFEPTVKLGVGGEKGKFTVQGTYSQKMNSGYLSYDPLIISVGFSIKLGAPVR
jgi:hypothetical protein